MKEFLIIKTGSTYSSIQEQFGDFEDWIIAGCRLPEGAVRLIDITLGDVFTAHVTYVQTVVRLPANAVRLVSNAFEVHHAFRVGDNAWGVQFHPEFNASIMHAYVREQADALRKAGHDVAAVRENINDTYKANALLKRFYNYCAEK